MIEAVTAAGLQPLLSRLVSIPSVNPELVPDGSGELGVAEYVAGWLTEQGFETRFQPTGAADRPNVIGVAKGRGGGRSVLLVAHLDTVGISGMKAPYSPRVARGRMYGRGSTDMKAGLAICMLAGAQAARERRRGDVIVAGVVDEEYRSIGCEALVREVRADGAILTESTGGRVVIAHKGFGWYEIETQGRAAHGSRPDLGIDAIVHMGGVLTGLRRLSDQLARVDPHALIGSPSIHASLIEGGQELSSYPAACRLQIERRTIPGESADEVLAQLHVILASGRTQAPNFRAHLRTLLWRDCLEQSADTPIAASLLRNAESITGTRPPVAAGSGWTDAALLAGAGTPTVIFGPHGDGAHGALEWVDLASVGECYGCVLATVRDFCG